MPFHQIAGHRSLLALLSRSIEHDRLPQSLMFAGPSGVGKRLAAGAVAQAMNCLAPVRESSRDGLPFDACGTCAACARIARGVHPDVITLQPGDNGTIKIDVVRDLIDRSGYRPFEGRRRVVIIDEADAMAAGAQNALLKTLEEPPSASAFILVTSRPDVLLITVRSRCPRLRFGPLDVDDVALVLRAKGHSDVEARRRIELAKELVPKTGGGGAVDREHLATHLRAMSSLIRDVELIAASGDPKALANLDLAPTLDRLSSYRGERGIQAFEAVDKALVALDRNAGVKIVADWVAMNL